MTEHNTVKDITFHYTNEQMVRDLLAITPMGASDSVLDAGSGKNKVWYNNLTNTTKYECELEDGVDFLTDWNTPVDWVVGNPPFHCGKDFLLKASMVAQKGIAFLGNLNFVNSTVLPSRLTDLQSKGFSLTHIHIVQDKRWFGRYFYLIFQKNVVSSIISWNNQTYKD